LALVLQIGPRIGKYDEEGNPRPIFGHHMPMVMFGTLILAFGWFGFQRRLHSRRARPHRPDRRQHHARQRRGTLAASLLSVENYGKPDPSMMCNGMLGGLVSITAGCAFVSPPAAVIIGLHRRRSSRSWPCALERAHASTIPSGRSACTAWPDSGA
jgi:ammonium transporter, Amt family